MAKVVRAVGNTRLGTYSVSLSARSQRSEPSHENKPLTEQVSRSGKPPPPDTVTVSSVIKEASGT